MRKQMDSDAQAQKASAKIADASNAAKSAAAQMRRARAAQAEGKAFYMGDIAAFTGKVSAEMQRDQAQLLELIELVRASFKTFSQVVRDNGLFAAFSEEGSYGSCSGYVLDTWWNDELEDEYIGLKPGEENTATSPPTCAKTRVATVLSVPSSACAPSTSSATGACSTMTFRSM